MKVLSLLFLLCLGGCQLWGTVINGGHRLYAIVDDDRTAKDDWTDVQINASVRDALSQRSGALLVDVEVTVFEGSVLLTGIVPKGEVLTDILEATWSVPGVRKVYNYVRVGASIKTKLALAAGIDATNYKLTLENGVIYLMGICKDDSEYTKVLSILKNTEGVDKIIYLMRRPI